MRHASLVASFLVIAISLHGVAAHAEDPQPANSETDEVLKQARQHHRVGVDAYAEGRFAEAIEAFIAADRLRPSAALSFNIAKAYERLDDVSRALAYYREYLHRAPPATEDRKSVNERVAELAKRLSAQGVQQVILRSTPPGATVLVNGEPVGSSPVVIELRPGAHHVEFRHPDYAPEQLDFELALDRPLDVSSVLVASAKPAAVAEPVVSADPPKTDSTINPELAAPAAGTSHTGGRADRPSSLTRTLGFAALGASVVALGGAVTFEIMRSNSENQASQETEQVRFAEELEEMETQQTWARVLAGAGGVLAAVGGVLVVMSSTSDEGKPRQGLAFNCAPTRCNATFSGSF